MNVFFFPPYVSVIFIGGGSEPALRKESKCKLFPPLVCGGFLGKTKHLHGHPVRVTMEPWVVMEEC